MTSWFDKPSELFRSDKITSFWPASKQSSAERINSSTRFILYSSCVLYLINRDIRVVVLALLFVTALYIMYKSGHIRDSKKESYTSVKSSVAEYLDNTVLYGPARTRSPTAEYQRKAFARQFITGPVSSIPGDQTGFAEWCYGKKFSSQCRNDPKNCDADYWGVQSSAFSGVDIAGNPRTGMGG